MAATAVVEGNFVNMTYREWDGFTDSRTQQVVKSGRKLLVNVYTAHDQDLVEVQADVDQIEAIRSALAGASFGVHCKLVCTANKYGKYIGFSAELPTSGK